MVARDNADEDVGKYAIKAATVAFLATDRWDVVQDYLLSSYRQSATVLPQVVNVTILRNLASRDVPKPLLTDFVNSRIPVLADLQKTGEIIWLLFLCLALDLPLRPKTVARLVTIEDGAIALLVADARQSGLIPANTKFILWNSFLTTDGLDGPMWLYAYESSMQGLSGIANRTHITSHAYFQFFAQKQITFYRSGTFHLNADATLRTQRLENLRRRILQAKLEIELGDDFDDFEPEPEDEDIYS